MSVQVTTKKSVWYNSNEWGKLVDGGYTSFNMFRVWPLFLK